MNFALSGNFYQAVSASLFHQLGGARGSERLTTGNGRTGSPKGSPHLFLVVSFLCATPFCIFHLHGFAVPVRACYGSNSG